MSRAPRPPQDADLVARALEALPDEERARVDAALERDGALRTRFETIAAHLLVYDQLPPAPPPPPFARLAAALDEDEGAPDLTVLRLQAPARPRRRTAWVAAAAAAAVLLALWIWRPGREAPESPLHIVAGAGLELLHDGARRPAPAGAEVPIAAGDLLRAHAPAEFRLAERVRVVLDAGAALRVGSAETVTLEAGRAWFEVAPGAFEVRTAHGPVRVLGTAFEVDVRDGTLGVAVAHGRVAAAGHELDAGMRLAAGGVSRGDHTAGAWFSRPRLRVERLPAGGPAATAGAPLRLALHLDNPGAVQLWGGIVPSDVRRPLWLYFEDAEGRPVGEIPVLPGQVRDGAGFLQPGRPLVALQPGETRTVVVEIPAPFASPGTYLCRALFRPAGQPGVLSDALRLEVR